MITLGLNRSGRVIQRDPRVPNVLSQYVDPGPAVIPLAPRKERGIAHPSSFHNLLTHAHTFAVDLCHHPLTTAAAASLPHMVRNYIRKGGHGGRRSNAGLPAGHWQDQGSRSAAAAAKAERIAKAQEEAAKKTAANHLAVVGQAQRRAAVGQHSAAASAAAS